MPEPKAPTWHPRELALLLAALGAAGLLLGLAWLAGERAAWRAERELERQGQFALEAAELALGRWRAAAERPAGSGEWVDLGAALEGPLGRGSRAQKVPSDATGRAPGGAAGAGAAEASGAAETASGAQAPDEPALAQQAPVAEDNLGQAADGQTPDGESTVVGTGPEKSANGQLQAPNPAAAVAQEPKSPWLELGAFPSQGWEPFDTDLEALRGESKPLAERLAALADLLELHPAARRRAEGLLDGVQWAREAGDGAALERWLAALVERAEPREARGGFAQVLLGALAAEGWLAPERQAEVGRQLLLWWAAGELALPEPVDRWEQDAAGPKWFGDGCWSALLLRIGAWLAQAPTELDAQWLGDSAGEPARRAQSWLRRYGADLERLSAASSNLWTPLADSAEGWWVQPEANGAGQAVWLPEGVLLEVLQGSAVAIDAGFRWSAVPVSAAADSTTETSNSHESAKQSSAATKAWRGGTWTPLPGLPELQLQHLEPKRFAAAERSRLAPLRYGLMGLALAVLLAGFAGARSLRRERRLGELKAQFIAGISHDLRTPIASILLMSENLTRGHIPAEQQRGRYFPALRREAERLRRRVDDLLDFSRLERGLSARLAAEAVELGPLCDDLEAELGAECQRAGVDFQMTRENLPDELYLDADALRRVLGNLVGNALRHAHTPRIQVHLSGLNTAGQQGLEALVTDFGQGISSSDRERAFLPFVQLAGARREAGGTGLGLSIVRELARAHGGEAAILEPSGPGTRVRVTFMEFNQA
jgi:signal transduction histidine kinase